MKKLWMLLSSGLLLAVFDMPSAFDGCTKDSQCGSGYYCAGGECYKHPSPPPPPPKKTKGKAK